MNMSRNWENTTSRAALAASARRWGLGSTTTAAPIDTEACVDTSGSLLLPPPTPVGVDDEAQHLIETSSHSGSVTSSLTETEESDDMTTTATETVVLEPSSVMRKKRKPTYYVRKDEMTRLREEIEALQEKLLNEEAKRVQANDALSKQLVMNAALASDVKQNEMVVTGMRAMICARNAQRDRNPLETYIRLTTNEDERRQTLLAIKEQKIFEGKEFIDEYCKRVVNPTRAMQDCQTYETQKGDFVLDQFDLTPFENAHSVKQVYDSLIGFFNAQEVSITVMLGVLSVRETDDCGESTASQCRLVSTFPNGVQVESNAVMYLRYCDKDEQGIELEQPYGFVTIDFVNDDELYPYKTTDRVREDITMVGIIKAFPNPAYDGGRNGEQEQIVAMARWGFTRLCQPQCPLPYGATQQLRDTIRSFSDVMPQVMTDLIGMSSAARRGGN